MASTKAATSIWDAFTLTGGAGPTTSTATIDLADGYGGVLDLKFTSTSGVSDVASIQIQVSQDNSGWFNFGGELTCLSGSSTSVSWGGIEIPIGAQYLRLVATHSPSATCIVNAKFSEVTAI